MWFELLSAAKTFFQIGKSSKAITHSSKRFLKKIKQGKLILPIFGAGGVGKTTLSRLLSGEDRFTLATNYSESTFVEHIELPGKVPCVLMVAPGQRLSKRFATTWLDLFEEANKTQSRLIINVVSYGFHAFQTASYKEVTSVYKEGMSKEEFITTYCEQKRAEELLLLEQLVEGIEAKVDRFTLLTVVTKADLWWDKRQKVMDFYEIGAYYKKLEHLYSSSKFSHCVMAISLSIDNFRDSEDEIVSGTATGYDLRSQNKLYDKLMNEIPLLLELK